MPSMEPDPSAQARVIAVIPIGSLEGAKSRLGETLDAEERRDLVTRLVRRTILAAKETPGIVETLVVTPDDEVRRLALELGARPIRQRGQGLNQGLREGRDEVLAAGADALLALPIDLPLISTDALSALLAPLARNDRPLVALVPDRHGRGTNALLLAPPDAIEFCFGGDSRAAHVECARSRGANLFELDGPLSFDLDTPDDLLRVEDLAPELVVGETADAR
jgi:2-phospho-L-lactate/phosphoenolpyruvate guanylyltransferase